MTHDLRQHQPHVHVELKLICNGWNSEQKHSTCHLSTLHLSTMASVREVGCCFIVIAVLFLVSHAVALRPALYRRPLHIARCTLMGAKSMRQQQEGGSQSELVQFLAATQLLVVCPVSILNLEQISSLKKTLVGGPHSTVVSESKLIEYVQLLDDDDTP